LVLAQLRDLRPQSPELWREAVQVALIVPDPKDDELAQNEGVNVVQVVYCHEVVDVTLAG
jgi:hypothetical protein